MAEATAVENVVLGWRVTMVELEAIGVPAGVSTAIVDGEASTEDSTGVEVATGGIDEIDSVIGAADELVIITATDEVAGIETDDDATTGAAVELATGAAALEETAGLEAAPGPDTLNVMSPDST